jgi:hypothetical protein
LNISKSSVVTIEEAVAQMVNLDYIPTGLTLMEMLAAFQEEAEVEYHNARIEILPVAQLAPLKVRVDACTARHTLAQLLIDHLRRELASHESSIAVVSNETSAEPSLDFGSVSDWASDRYGIDIKEDTGYRQGADGAVDSAPKVRWEEVIIKIYANHKLAFSKRGGDWTPSSFQDIDLMGARKNEPNQRGGILLGLCLGKKFPSGKAPQNKDAAAISKLRRALEKLTGLSNDPFLPISEGDGWKPRFKLIDCRRIGDERAKDRAVHVSFDESRDFDIEKDDGQRWLDENS